MEQQIQIAAKLYKCRDAAKSIYGTDYKEKIGDYRRYILSYMVKHSCETINAAMGLIEEVKDIDGVGMVTMNVLAACCEILEPSKDIQW